MQQTQGDLLSLLTSNKCVHLKLLMSKSAVHPPCVRNSHLHTVSRFLLSTAALLPAPRLRTRCSPAPSDAIPGPCNVRGCGRRRCVVPGCAPSLRQGRTSCLRHLGGAHAAQLKEGFITNPCWVIRLPVGRFRIKARVADQQPSFLLRHPKLKFFFFFFS